MPSSFEERCRELAEACRRNAKVREFDMLFQSEVAPLEAAARLIEALPGLADQLVESLFVNGAGARADRLVLTMDTTPKQDLGGWSRGAIAEQIREALAARLRAGETEPGR